MSHSMNCALHKIIVQYSHNAFAHIYAICKPRHKKVLGKFRVFFQGFEIIRLAEP